MRDGILEGKSTAELQRVAVESGMSSLGMDGLAKVAAGLTSLEEILPFLSDEQDTD